MDVGELLAFQPEKPGFPSSGNKRKQTDDDEYKGAKKPVIDSKERERILKMVQEEPEPETLNELALKKMILQFEKRVYKNQEMRIKFPDLPEKFMESELELNDIIQEMHVIATVPDLYYVLVDLNAVQSILQLLNHENTDISIATVDLLQEMTDVDTLTESEDGTNVLIDALLEGQLIAQLVENMERLDESVREESEGVHNTLSIVENLTELRPEVCIDAAQQGLMQWLLKRLKAKMLFDANKLYASEILSILLQNHEENRQTLGEIEGIDVLLSQLAAYKRHNPSSVEEIEMMENLFDCLCSSLMLPANRERFLRGEGLQLMNLMLREKKMSRYSAVKVLNHAMQGPEGTDNCNKFVDILGLRSIFPLFMKTPKTQKKAGAIREELEEHIVAIIASMVRNCQGTQKQRLLNKFAESDHEKVDRLMELHFKYLHKMNAIDDKIEREKQSLRVYGGEVTEEMEDEFYLQRLEAGLFTLQLIDYIMLEISTSPPPTVRQRVMQIVNMRGGLCQNHQEYHERVCREHRGREGHKYEGGRTTENTATCGEVLK
ncbi:Beta-catenin-like protein 1 [Lamellibrachia satsuma]|nr:Beta-catenin-like protein 1 [Lamellibrachia satsuma]